MVECKTENLKEANLDRYVSLLQDIDSQPENDPSNPGIGPLRPQKSCESNSEKLAKRKHPWIRNYGLRNTLTSLEESPENSPEKSHGWFKPTENQPEEKAIKVEVTDDLVLNVDMNVAIDKSAADIDLKVETKDYESMDEGKDGMYFFSLIITISFLPEGD